MKGKIVLSLATLAIFTMIPFTAARAFDVRSGNNVIVDANETVDGNLYAAGAQVVVDGKVNGDIFCAGSTVTINGEVEGDVLCAGSSITVNGKVLGDIRSASSELSLNGEVSGGLTSFGSAININHNASVGSNVLAFGATLRADGPIDGDLQFFGASLLLNNKVAGDVSFYGENRKTQKNGPAITMRADTDIAGNLSYYEGVSAEINDAAKIAGETTIMEMKKYEQKQSRQMFAMFPIWLLIWSVLSFLIIAMIFVSIFPKQTNAAIEVMLKKPSASIGWGMVAMIVIPVIIVILLFTVIGIPLAIFFAALFAAMCMLAKIIAGIAIGALLARWLKWKISLYWQAVLGIILSVLIFSVPVFGWLLGLIAFFWAFGGLILYKKEVYKKLEG